MDILEESKNYKRDADKFLNDSGLLELLGKFGEIDVSGSYAADLMMVGDIDLHLFGVFDRKKAQKVFDYLIENTSFTGYMFFDWVTFHNSAFPHGYYIGIKQKMDGYQHQWKVDIWLMKEQRKESKEYMNLLKDISDQQKLAILSFKKYRESNRLEIPSNIIYDAVLKNNIMKLDEFRAFLNN